MDLYSSIKATIELPATALAGAIGRRPRALRILRTIPLPGKRQIVQRLDPERLQDQVRATVDGQLYDLDLREHLDRNLYFGDYERADLRSALRQVPPGGVCLDVGANIGVYTLNLAQALGPDGRVHAFEPDPDNFSRLEKHCQINGLEDRVTLNREAISDRVGEAALHRVGGRSADTTLAGFGRDWPITEQVSTCTIDGYLEEHGIEHLDLAKIDVEGHELHVLAGAQQTLHRSAIGSLLIEFNGGRLAQEGHTLEDFLSAVEGHGYRAVERNLWFLWLLRRRLVDPARVCVNFLFKPVGGTPRRGLPLRAASAVKAALAARLPAKVYWHLMGRFRAVPAVTSELRTIEESLESGKQVVELLESLDLVHPEAEVLQIGSGIGRVEYHLARSVRRCTGLDISPAMVERARSLVSLPNVEFRCTGGTDLEGVEAGSLDLVFSVFVFQHIPREQVGSYIDQAYEALRPGGSMVFQMMIDEPGIHPEPGRSHPYALRRYRRAGVTESLRNAGFSDIRVVEMDGAPDRGLPSGDVVFAARKT